MGGNNDGARINKCQISFVKPKEKEVELVREDGSKELLKLVKWVINNHNWILLLLSKYLLLFNIDN